MGPSARSVAGIHKMAINLTQLARSPALFRDSIAVVGNQPFSAVLAPFQKRDFAALDQATFDVAAGRMPTPSRIWLERTKGASKDTDLAVALLWLLAFCGRQLHCQVAAADQDQANELHRAAESIVRQNPWLSSSCKIEVGKSRIQNNATGSRLLFLTSDDKSSHGARPDVLVINELTHTDSHDFVSTLLDNATKVPNCLVIVATNAGFVDAWQYTMRESSQRSQRWYFATHNEPAPWLNAADVAEREQNSTPSRFRRLWKGEWLLSKEGDALPADLIAASATAIHGLQDGNGWLYVAGLDIAVKRDHSALCISCKHVGWTETRRTFHKPPLRSTFRSLADHGDFDLPPENEHVEYIHHRGTGRIRVVGSQGWKPPRGGRIELDAVQQAVIDADQIYQFAGVFFDPTQAEHMAQTLEKLGLPMIPVPPNGKNNDLMAQEVMQHFNNGSIEIVNDSDLIRDLTNLTIAEKSYGYSLQARRTAEHGHSDRAFALATALLGLKRFSHTASHKLDRQLICYP